MMKKLLLLLPFLFLFAAPETAQAQNVTCATRPAGDISNACATTAFVYTAVRNIINPSVLPLLSPGDGSTFLTQYGPNSALSMYGPRTVAGLTYYDNIRSTITIPAGSTSYNTSGFGCYLTDNTALSTVSGQTVGAGTCYWGQAIANVDNATVWLLATYGSDNSINSAVVASGRGVIVWESDNTIWNISSQFHGINLILGGGVVPTIGVGFTVDARGQKMFSEGITIASGAIQSSGVGLTIGAAESSGATVGGIASRYYYRDGASALQYWSVGTTANGDFDFIAPSISRLFVLQSALQVVGNAQLLGVLQMAGGVSGQVTIQTQSAAGTYNFNLPITAGSSGQPLVSSGGGATAQVYATLGIFGGGTNCSVASGTCLDNITAFASTGIIVRTGAGAYSFRTVTASTGITVSNGDGVAGNPTVSITNTIAAAGPIGGATSIPVITYNAQGQLTTVTTATPTVTVVNGVAYPASYTSGGIPYASGTATISSSALLAAGLMVQGGGAGTAPSTFTLGGDCTFTTPNITCTKVNGVSHPSSMTSGGILYASSTSAVASSALLAANAIMLGGGAGNPPTTTTTGTGVVTALGINVGSAGAFVTFNGALGTPSGGTLTNATGLPAATGIANGALPAGVTINNGNWSGTALVIGNGGTGQITKAAAFDALSPMTTAGDIIYGGTAGTGTRLAAGTSSQVLTGGTTPAWGSVTNAMLAQAGANTFKANVTSGTANETDASLPSCSTTGSGLNYTSGTGLACASFYTDWTTFTLTATCNGTTIVPGTNGALITKAEYLTIGAHTVIVNLDFTCPNNSGTGTVVVTLPKTAIASGTLVGQEQAITAAAATAIFVNTDTTTSIRTNSGGSTWAQSSRFFLQGHIHF